MAQEFFEIDFLDPCFDNTLVAKNSPLDVSLEFNIDANTVSTGQSIAKFTETLSTCTLVFMFYVNNPSTGVWQDYASVSGAYPFILNDSLSRIGGEYTKTINFGKPASISNWTSYRP